MRKSNEQSFRDHILAWQQSGLSQKAWCTANDIAYSTFHYWCRRFRNQSTGKQQNKPDAFVQLVVQEQKVGLPWCELVLGGGQRIIFHQPVTAEFISNLLD